MTKLEQTCKRKKYFRTKKIAKAWARKKRFHGHLIAYKCPVCDGFHLTTKTDMKYKIAVRRGNLSCEHAEK